MRIHLPTLKLIRENFIGNMRPAGIFSAVGMMALVTAIAVIFRHIGITESNVIMLYILGVLLVSIQGDGYVYGILASLLGVLSFNFFFVEPLYTFLIHSGEYIVTFAIMLLVALITSTLTSKVKLEAEISQIREKRSELLYNISRNLLTSHNFDQIITTAAVNIANACGCGVVMYLADDSGVLLEPYLYAVNNEDNLKLLVSDREREYANCVYSGEKVMSDKVYYTQVYGRSKVLGVIGVNSVPGSIPPEQKALIEAIAVQIALTIERENFSKKQQQSNVEMESERLRSNLLRAVSHDLKTPLAGIVGSASTILDSWQEIDDESKKTLLTGIFEDAQWLGNSVDNILSITRIEDGRVEVKKSMEAAEEIIGEAASRVSRYAGSRSVSVKIPESLVLVPMDGRLIEQVLVNLLDNAIKYTPEGSYITIEFFTEGKNAVFVVADNGLGIEEKDLPLVFDRFYTAGVAGSMARKGIGLGLAICKSIVTAHRGMISVSNRKSGGAEFRFTLPLEE